MALADSKKVQTMVNICAEQAQIVRAAIVKMKAVRTVYLAAAPAVTDTVLDGGNAATLSSAINALDTLVNTTDAAIWTALINSYVPSHRNQALEV